jgi:hypothetical protein
MTDKELLVIEKAIHNLSVALVSKITKTSIQALVWFTREELKKLTKDKMSQTSECPNHEKECGK